MRKVQIHPIMWEAAQSGSGAWLASCRQLGLDTWGRTPGELAANIVEVMNALMVSLVEAGDLEDYFRRKGVQIAVEQLSTEQPEPFGIPHCIVRKDAGGVGVVAC